MTDDPRRLGWQGTIERLPKTHRYRVTGAGLRTALFFTRTDARLLRPKLAEIMAVGPPPASQHRAAFDRVQAEGERACRDEKLAA